MLKLVVFVAVVGVAFGAFTGDPRRAQIIQSNINIDPDGTYQYAYETENGITANENGAPKGISGGTDPPPVVATGGYKYESPEGEIIEIQYVADENGYQPYGNAIPTPPPIPPAIQRSLEFIAANPVKSDSNTNYNANTNYKTNNYNKNSNYNANNNYKNNNNNYNYQNQKR